MILTTNEKQVMRFLATSIGEDHSINEIAKECNISPNGAYKLLKKLEKEEILKSKQIANIKTHKPNFTNEKTTNILELALMPKPLQGRVKIRADDLHPLKQITQSCILFGSYISEKKKPRDLDILFIIKKEKFETYKKVLAEVQDIIPIKIQDVVQTTQDIKQNLKKNDPIVVEALCNGIVLWGYSIIAKEIKNATT